MIHEYLFSTDEKREEIENYQPEKIRVSALSIENTHCWILTYEVDGENETSAKVLSDENKRICQKYRPIVLANGSSAYYNQRLFPLINRFERMLRNLLYLKSVISIGDPSINNISSLEDKALGDVFDMLFTDEQFINSSKGIINKKTWRYTKAEILCALNEIQENTIWDALLGKNAVPELQKNFSRVRTYRNDVMHAHNIDHESYLKAKRLFNTINTQLITELGLLVNKDQPVASDDVFNETLKNVIHRADLTEKVSYLLQDYERIQAEHQKQIEMLIKETEKYEEQRQQLFAQVVSDWDRSDTMRRQIEDLGKVFATMR